METKFQKRLFAVIKKYGKGIVVQIPAAFENVYHIACQRVLRNSPL